VFSGGERAESVRVHCAAAVTISTLHNKWYLRPLPVLTSQAVNDVIDNRQEPNSANVVAALVRYNGAPRFTGPVKPTGTELSVLNGLIPTMLSTGIV
jgi:hypothetical protein